jgi:hypothetical protein
MLKVFVCLAGLIRVHAELAYPEQIKRAWTENEHKMRVSWVTS